MLQSSSRRLLIGIRSTRTMMTMRTVRLFSDSSEGTKKSAPFESAKKSFQYAKKAFEVAGLLALGGFIWSGFDKYSQVKEVVVDASAFYQALLKSTLPPRDKELYIERPDLDSEIKRIVKANISGDGPYCVVYGPKGAGKSELVDHYAMGKKPVVKLLVPRAHSSVELLESLSTKLLGKVVTGLNVNGLQAAVSKSTTIIFEVDCSADLKTMSAVRSFAKALAPFCQCIIVLPEANAVLEFGKNSYLERYVYVSEMTHEEAKLFMQRHILLKEEFKVDGEIFRFSDEELQNIFDNIGTNPSMLKKLIGNVVSLKMSVKQCVNGVLHDAEIELLAFPHQQILQALKGHPEGVSPGYFNNQKSKGVDLSNPKAVGAAMKDSNAIVYRMGLDLYQLSSTAYKTALRSYEPILPK